MKNIKNRIKSKMSAKLLKKAAIIVAGGAIGTGVVVFGAPLAVAALGFGSSGIAAGSTAAWLMGLSGGATKAGGFVALCQSIGATGAVSASTGVVGTAVGGISGCIASKKKGGSKGEPHQGPDQESGQEQCEGESNEENEEDKEQNVGKNKVK